jgi:hypothetical protein
MDLEKILKEHKEWLLDETKGTQADLSRTDLREVNLSWTDLTKANLQGANLQGAYLQEANLRGAYLRGANLQGADLRGADLPFCFVQAYIAPWQVLVTPEYIQVGCEKHSIDKWIAWGLQDDPEEIHAMHSHARVWWNRHKDIVLTMAYTVRLNESHPITAN